MLSKKRPYYQIVAEKLIRELEAGTAPWQRAWKPGEVNAGLPRNPITGQRYHAANALNLMAQGHVDSRWMTYDQAASIGAHVRHGEKGTPIQFWTFPKQERPRVFHAVVFNAEQIDGLPPLEVTQLTRRHNERAEQILKASGAIIQHINENRAYYTPSTDTITLPMLEQFDTPNSYYATALHMLGHWTGHRSRLDRDMAHPFGSDGYAKEELRAEIASILLADELNIGHELGQHAAYVAAWVKVLRDDPAEIIRAARDAEQIQNYVMAFEQVQEQTMIHTEASMTMMTMLERRMRDFDWSYDNSDDINVGQRGNKEFLSITDDLRKLAADNPAAAASLWDSYAQYKSRPNFLPPPSSESLDAMVAAKFLTLKKYRDSSHLSEYYHQAFNTASKDALGFTLPYDWNGFVRIQGNVKQVINGQEHVEPATDGVEPQFWSVYAQHEDGTFQWLADTDNSEQAEKLAERLALIDANSQADEGEKAIRLARVHEDHVRRDPNSTDEDISAAKLARKRLENPIAPHLKKEGHRVYIHVPHKEKDNAKAIGAKWDWRKKQWYIPEGIDPALFVKWMTPSQPATARFAPPTVPPEEEFGEFLRSLGLVIDGPPTMDGQKHRVPVEGDTKGNKSGFYIGFLDGHPAGQGQNFKAGVKENWKSKGYKLAAPQIAAMAAEAAEKRRAREAAQQKTHEDTAARLVSRMEKLLPATSTSYLTTKGIQPEKGIFTDGNGNTYIPAYDVNGKLWTIQYVQADGTKRFAKDSRKEGCFHPIGGVAALEKATVLVIAEGYATAATTVQSRDNPTTAAAAVVAFDSSNLKVVALALHEKYPSKPIVIAGDDDRHNAMQHGHNTGREAAEAAAKAVGGVAVFPVFAPEESSWPGDVPIVTPETYKAHLAACARIEKDKNLTTPPDGLLSNEQLAVLARMKRFTDFNDLATQSKLGASTVARQIGVAVEQAIQRTQERQRQIDDHMMHTVADKKVQERVARHNVKKARGLSI
jgi:antirestriction protein ArdC/phage/plasmid primase-like uncharacterized protein